MPRFNEGFIFRAPETKVEKSRPPIEKGPLFVGVPEEVGAGKYTFQCSYSVCVFNRLFSFSKFSGHVFDYLERPFK